MQSLNQFTVDSFNPSDIEKHVRRARAMRSEAVSNSVKETLRKGSQMIQEFMANSESARVSNS